jgi:hypothetical protein
MIPCARAVRSAFTALLLGVTLPAIAAGPPVVGTWGLVSYAREDPATGASTFPWGEKPSGLLLFLPDGHMSVVINAQGRQPAARGEDGFVEKQAKLFQTVTAYAGTYAVRGSTMTVRVEVAGDPGLVGTELSREIRVDGDLLTIRTQPMKSLSDGKMYVYALVWKRRT